MQIPDDIVTEYPKDNAILVNDPRVFRGVLIAAKTWGTGGLSGPNADGEEFDELLGAFADSIADLRAKYEVTGDTLNGDSAMESEYLDELHTLLETYRTAIFETALDYVTNDNAIEIMTELLEYND